MPARELLVGGLRLDEERQRVCREDGVEVELTGTSFVCCVIDDTPDRVLSKSRLTEHVYEGDQDRDSNVLEVYIRRLRDKIGRDQMRHDAVRVSLPEQAVNSLELALRVGLA